MISVLGSFTCITQHTGPTALRPIRRTKQLWLSVLLKDTNAATGQAGIRTHILITPEIESTTLDCSATTLSELGVGDGGSCSYCTSKVICFDRHPHSDNTRTWVQCAWPRHSNSFFKNMGLWVHLSPPPPRLMDPFDLPPGGPIPHPLRYRRPFPSGLLLRPDQTGQSSILHGRGDTAKNTTVNTAPMISTQYTVYFLFQSNSLHYMYTDLVRHFYKTFLIFLGKNS